MKHPETEQEFIERAEAIERSAQADQARRAARAEVDWPELPVLRPVTVQPVKLTAPEFAARMGECPECPEAGVIDLRWHRCPAKD